MYHTCKFDPSMLVPLEDNAKMRKMFKFNDNYCYVYGSSNTHVSVEVIHYLQVMLSLVKHVIIIQIHIKFVETWTH